MPKQRKQRELQAERRSYLLYVKQSLLVNKKSYISLLISIICMVVMCGNIIIYNSSKSAAENETIRQTYGDYHLFFPELTPSQTEAAKSLSTVNRVANIKVFSPIYNPNPGAGYPGAFVAEYTDAAEELFYVTPVEGRVPGKYEIYISERMRSAFDLDVGDKIDIRIPYGIYNYDMTFTVSGVFSSSEGIDEYAFISAETTAEIEALDAFSVGYSYDTFIRLKNDGNVTLQNSVLALMKAFGGNAGSAEEDSDDTSSTASDRAQYINAERCAIKEFYEKPSFLLTMALSILPAAIALFIFVVLDVYKSMRELSTLTMIGTTGQQTFLLLLLKYIAVYIIGFPVGMVLSAGLIKLLSVLCDRMNQSGAVLMKFGVSISAVLFLFALCLLILVGIVFIVSRRMTSSSYSEMLSSSKSMTNIFVRSTSDMLLKDGKKKRRLGLLFFIRNRRLNTLYCVVIAVITAVFSYFSMALIEETGNIPRKVDHGDFVIVGNTDKSARYNTIDADAVLKFAALDGVTEVYESYYVNDYHKGADPVVLLSPDKRVSKPRSSLSTAYLNKTNETDTMLIAEDYARAETLYGKYVVSGNLRSIYEDETKIAVFVHDWQSSPGYYRAGDTVKLKRSSKIDIEGVSTAYQSYTIGAVLYDRFDEYEFIDVVRILVSPALFSDFTGIDEPSSLTLNVSGTAADAENAISALCHETGTVCRNENAVYTENLSRSQMSIAFYALLFLDVAFLLAMMLISLSDFLLRCQRGTISTMSMLGAKRRELFSIFGGEALLNGAISALGGVLLTAVVMLVYLSGAAIPMTAAVKSALAAVPLFSALLCILTPCLYGKYYFAREKYTQK